MNFTEPIARSAGQGVNLTIDRQLHRILKDLAYKQDTTIAALIRIAVAEKYGNESAAA